jgi:hypothetical protein
MSSSLRRHIHSDAIFFLFALAEVQDFYLGVEKKAPFASGGLVCLEEDFHAPLYTLELLPSPFEQEVQLSVFFLQEAEQSLFVVEDEPSAPSLD